MIITSLSGLGAISHSAGLGAISHSGGLGAISHSGGLGAISHSMGLLGLGESTMASNLLKLAIGGGLLYAGYRFMQDRAEKREMADRRLIQMRGALGRARRRRRPHAGLMGLGAAKRFVREKVPPSLPVYNAAQKTTLHPPHDFIRYYRSKGYPEREIESMWLSDPENAYNKSFTSKSSKPSGSETWVDYGLLGGLLGRARRRRRPHAGLMGLGSRSMVSLVGSDFGRARRRRPHAGLMGLGYSRSGVSLVGSDLGRARRRKRHSRAALHGLGSAGLGFRGRPVARSRRTAMRMPYSF